MPQHRTSHSWAEDLPALNRSFLIIFNPRVSRNPNRGQWVTLLSRPSWENTEKQQSHINLDLNSKESNDGVYEVYIEAPPSVLQGLGIHEGMKSTQTSRTSGT